MEKEEENQPKKETACLFYNFIVNNNVTPLSNEIKARKSKLKNMCDKMNSEAEKFYLSQQDHYMKSNLKYYKFWKMLGNMIELKNYYLNLHIFHL